VQRAGLKELFDVDLKNLKKSAELLDKFDPKSDGADRDWVKIYEESERLPYEELNYMNEADNADRFRKDFKDIPWVRVPKFYRNGLTTPRVLTMEFVESLKLTDIAQIEKLGLDRDLLSKRVADSFLRQIVETGYFHADPHPGNLCVDTKGNLVYYDFGMMDEEKPNVRRGFRKFCTALFAGGPKIDDATLALNAKMLVDGVEEAGVLARGADRLAVEKLARYFMRTFKDNQMGIKGKNIKQAVGTDLQALTESNVFKFPSTFTFIFRSFASVDGIGKGLTKGFDIGKLSQPFVEKFIDDQKGYFSPADKTFSIFKKATGLNRSDISTAVTTPRKIAYIEDTVRAMEEGTLKIRVRSMENEKALERMALTQSRMENLLLTSVMLTCSSLVPTTRPLIRAVTLAGSGVLALQAFLSSTKVKKFDKTQAKFVSTSFTGEDEESNEAIDVDVDAADEILN
jgi:predicted unusual protein kinase regulating ubiquinone biosynthesis (AarF/ABC1/UbiB family)